MISDAIRTLLVNAATAAASRVYVDQVTESAALPYVRITTLGGAAINTHDGPAGMREFSFQVTAFASSGVASRSLSEACRTALNFYRGTVGGDVIQVIYARSEPTTNFEPTPTVYATSIDYEAGYVG